jgi:hypothetical protein
MSPVREFLSPISPKLFHRRCPAQFGESKLKFFTMSMWCGTEGQDDYDPIPDFRAHLDTIRDRLPADLLALQESISLHDSRVREMNFDTESKQLEIRLEGSDGKGGLRHFSLRYEGLVTFRSTADPKIGLRGPHGYGDLGNDEADITDEGDFEHRILFSTGIELQIIFRSFTLAWRDAT